MVAVGAAHLGASPPPRRRGPAPGRDRADPATSRSRCAIARARRARIGHCWRPRSSGSPSTRPRRARGSASSSPPRRSAPRRSTLLIAASSVEKGESLVDTLRTLERTGVTTLVLRHGSSGRRAPRGSADGPARRERRRRRPCPPDPGADRRADAARGARHARGPPDRDRRRRRRTRAWRARTSTACGTRALGCGWPDLRRGSLASSDWPGVEVAGDADRRPLRRGGRGDGPSRTARTRRRAARRADGLAARQLPERDGLAGPEPRSSIPGPTNEGVELTAELANGPRSLIGRQVENGVPVRMAVLALARRSGMSTESFGRLTDPPASFTVVGARVVDPSAGTDAVRDVAVVDGLIARSAAGPAPSWIDGRGSCWRRASATCTPTSASRGRRPPRRSRAAPGGGARRLHDGLRDAEHRAADRLGAEAVATALVGAAGTSCRVRVIGAATIGASRRRSAVDAGRAWRPRARSGFSDDGACVRPTAVARRCLVQLARARPAADRARRGRRSWPAAASCARARWQLGWDWPAGRRRRRPRSSSATSRSPRRRGARAPPHAPLDRGRRASRCERRELAGVAGDLRRHATPPGADGRVGRRARGAFAWERGRDGAADRAAYDGACRVNPPLASREDALALLAARRRRDDRRHRDRPRAASGRAQARAVRRGRAGAHRPRDGALAGPRRRRGREAGAWARWSRRSRLARRAIIGETRGLDIGVARRTSCSSIPAARWRVEREALASASSNTPLLGMELPGVVRLTVAAGRVTYRS